MKLRFFWFESQGRFYPSYECLDKETGYLFSILVDDGGLGLDHHIPWLGECVTLCEKVLRGESASEYFTAEVFAAYIEPERTSVHSITSEPDSGEFIQTALFLRIVSDWLKFLERGLHKDYAEDIVHHYGP